jgi:catalase
VNNIFGHAGGPSVTDGMKPRILEYWFNVGKELGRKVAEGKGAE